MFAKVTVTCLEFMYFHSLALQEVSVAQAYQPIISTFQRIHVLSAQFREEEREADESIVGLCEIKSSPE